MKPKIPRGWSKMRKNEIIREGDKFFNDIETIAPLGWTPSLSIGFRVHNNHNAATYIRRAARRGRK